VGFEVDMVSQGVTEKTEQRKGKRQRSMFGRTRWGKGRWGGGTTEYLVDKRYWKFVKERLYGTGGNVYGQGWVLVEGMVAGCVGGLLKSLGG